MPFEVKNAPAVFAHMHVPRTPRLVLAPGPAKSPSTVPQWTPNLASRLKKAHSDVVSRDLLAVKGKKSCRWRRGLFTLQSRRFDNDACSSSVWFARKVTKPLARPFHSCEMPPGNTYPIKQANNFRKRFLRHHSHYGAIFGGLGT